MRGSKRRMATDRLTSGSRIAKGRRHRAMTRRRLYIAAGVARRPHRKARARAACQSRALQTARPLQSAGRVQRADEQARRARAEAARRHHARRQDRRQDLRSPTARHGSTRLSLQSTYRTLTTVSSSRPPPLRVRAASIPSRHRTRSDSISRVEACRHHRVQTTLRPIPTSLQSSTTCRSDPTRCHTRRRLSCRRRMEPPNRPSSNP